MANRAAPFTEADITRAAKGALKAGLKIREVIASAEGVRVICGDAPSGKADGVNPWDAALNG